MNTLLQYLFASEKQKGTCLDFSMGEESWEHWPRRTRGPANTVTRKYRPHPTSQNSRWNACVQLTVQDGERVDLAQGGRGAHCCVWATPLRGEKPEQNRHLSSSCAARVPTAVLKGRLKRKTSLPSRWILTGWKVFKSGNRCCINMSSLVHEAGALWRASKAWRDNEKGSENKN